MNKEVGEVFPCVDVAGSVSSWKCDVEMKIDDKVMCYFESSNTPVDKEGYLYKKVGHN